MAEEAGPGRAVQVAWVNVGWLQMTRERVSGLTLQGGWISIAQDWWPYSEGDGGGWEGN